MKKVHFFYCTVQRVCGKVSVLTMRIHNTNPNLRTKTMNPAEINSALRAKNDELVNKAIANYRRLRNATMDRVACAQAEFALQTVATLTGFSASECRSIYR
jgi:hypothetical protein